MATGITDHLLGSGREAKLGTIVGVRYRGTLTDGTEFDASLDVPLRIPLGEGALIEGFEQGLLGMKVGGKRRLEIPPELGYGEDGFPPDIPANATLVFELELVEVSDMDEY